jgi:RNA polymerase sigma-70 factor (ECF subfamily)
VGQTERQDDLFQAIAQYGAALDRLAVPTKPIRKNGVICPRKSNSQSGAVSSVSKLVAHRTWIYRVAHNTASNYIVRQRRANISKLVTLAEVEAAPDPINHQRHVEQHIALDRLLQLIHRLRPMDRQVMLLYLEDMDAESIGEITGISAGNVRVLIHRVKIILARQFHEGRPT